MCLMSAPLKKGITAIHTATWAWLNRAAKTVLLNDMQNFGFSAMPQFNAIFCFLKRTGVFWTINIVFKKHWACLM